MSQTRFRCPTCKHVYPIRVRDLDKTLYCKRCDARFRLPRIDDYVLLDELGHGAFSVVYLAYDLHNHREIALKQLDEKAIPQHEFESWIKRAIVEARALAAIGFHPNVLPLYTSGRIGRKFYMVTPVIRGKSLDQVIPEKGFADPLHAVELGIIILRALYHVHGFKVHHRDVKPSNIMIAENGNLSLIDFGLVACRQIDTSLHTEMGTVLGTAAYMPPEQARGEIDRVGPWSDQYGAGVVLFKMLTGNVPYPAGNAYAVVAAVGDYNKPPLPPRHFRLDLDADLEDLVLKALRKFPGERFKSCAEFADNLQAWIERWKKRQVPVPPSSAPFAPKSELARERPSENVTLQKPHRPQAILWMVIVIAALAALGIGGGLAWKTTDKVKQPVPTTKHDLTE